MSDDRYDVIIVGGGPVGLSMALALSRFQRGLKLALVDRRPFTVPDDKRAFALSAGVRRVLDTLGVWPAIQPQATAIEAMVVTDSGGDDLSRPVFLSFAGDVAPGEPYAHMVANRTLTAALLAAVGERAELIAPAEVAGFSAGPASAALALRDGRTLRAPLVVAADGAMSGLRRLAGIDVVAHDYRQAGIVTTIAHDLPHEGTAYEHFRPAGPFASLPLGGNRSSLVWTETSAEAARLKELPPEEVAVLIEAAMGSRLGKVRIEEGLQSFPLRLQLARSFVAPRLALIGDAAHVIHPLAGQGLNLGLKDVAALSEAVVEALRLGRDAGAADVLAGYERWRRFDATLMAAVTDNLNRLFSNDVPPVRALRDIGLGLVDRLPAVKAALIARAAGIEANGPRLLRGLPL
ncbi:MAG TPA: FAD-dependent monooxygenase [Devosia sp.]|nr:FAD-dependent monooxygenase [Devosia sp.]